MTRLDTGDLIARLRALQPDRAMSWAEAHSIAERQAALLLDLWSVDGPPVPQFVISSLPGLLVEWRADWPADATSFDTGSHWRVVVRSTDRRQRQRFSLAHELKHVIDDPYRTRLFAHLAPSEQRARAERLCNYFAACLLMPRPWLKHDWCGGLQTPRELARHYFVSAEAMKTRLSEIGLTPMTLTLEQSVRRHTGTVRS
jgi:hypothetical protein